MDIPLPGLQGRCTSTHIAKNIEKDIIGALHIEYFERKWYRSICKIHNLLEIYIYMNSRIYTIYNIII